MTLYIGEFLYGTGIDHELFTIGTLILTLVP